MPEPAAGDLPAGEDEYEGDEYEGEDWDQQGFVDEAALPPEVYHMAGETLSSVAMPPAGSTVQHNDIIAFSQLLPVRRLPTYLRVPPSFLSDTSPPVSVAAGARTCPCDADHTSLADAVKDAPLLHRSGAGAGSAHRGRLQPHGRRL